MCIRDSTGTVGGRIPCGGLLLATDNLNEIKSLIHTNENNGSATAEAGVRLADFQRFVETERAEDYLPENIEATISRLEKEMRGAAKHFEFERAAELRDRIKALRERELQLT